MEHDADRVVEHDRASLGPLSVERPSEALHEHWRGAVPLARVLYNEPYRRVPMRCGAESGPDGVRVWHQFGRGWSLTMRGTAEAAVPQEPLDGPIGMPSSAAQ